MPGSETVFAAGGQQTLRPASRCTQQLTGLLWRVGTPERDVVALLVDRLDKHPRVEPPRIGQGDAFVLHTGPEPRPQMEAPGRAGDHPRGRAEGRQTAVLLAR